MLFRSLTDGMRSFHRYCIAGIRADESRIAEQLSSSLMLVTALVPYLGYDAAAAIAHDAHRRGVSLKDAALASGLLSAEQFDQWVRPSDMIHSLPE